VSQIQWSAFDALPGLIGLDEQPQPRERELPRAGEVLGVRVEGLLDEAQRGGRQGEYLVRPATHLVAQLGGWHHPVHQTPVLGRLGVVLPAEHPDLPGTLLPDYTRQVGGAEAGVEGADPRPGLTEKDVAAAIAFLASERAGFITGQTVSVSGGLTMA
jgi:hypothetical protein